ncbi:hypothetical protein F7725_013547 [Dissostichus mawsoni]|uniref:Uncharacterized protein n=1 Tax=Dissostichus mawsoni TaxID=36200 RepID=A0A7J5Y465_DISMA|nr:hypothetical protein F7725_013547 [Dissostichus mawsoni]
MSELRRDLVSDVLSNSQVRVCGQVTGVTADIRQVTLNLCVMEAVHGGGSVNSRGCQFTLEHIHMSQYLKLSSLTLPPRRMAIFELVCGRAAAPQRTSLQPATLKLHQAEGLCFILPWLPDRVPAHRLQHEQGLLAWLSTASGPLASYGELFSPLQLAQLVKLQPRLHLSGLPGDTICLKLLPHTLPRSACDLLSAGRRGVKTRRAKTKGALTDWLIWKEGFAEDQWSERETETALNHYTVSHDAVQAEDSHKCIPRLHLTPPPSLFSGDSSGFWGSSARRVNISRPRCQQRRADAGYVAHSLQRGRSTEGKVHILPAPRPLNKNILRVPVNRLATEDEPAAAETSHTAGKY